MSNCDIIKLNILKVEVFNIMNIEKLIEFVNSEFPDNATEIRSAIELMSEALSTYTNNIRSKYYEYSSFEYFETDKFSLLRNNQEELHNIIKTLNSYIEKLTPNFSMDEDGSENDELTRLIEADEGSAEQKELIKKCDINYNDPAFNVNPNKPHTLYENFTYTKPCAIEIEDKRIEVAYWKELLAKTCDYLFAKDEKLFRSFLSREDMNGSNRKYFSTIKQELASPQRIKNSDIYVIGNISANQARNIIIRMLGEFNIPRRLFTIYLSRDLSSLHKNQNITIASDEKTISVQTNTPDGELKIGQYVIKSLKEIFGKPISESELENLQNEQWCHEVLGICYPLLKKYDPSQPLKEQLKYKNQENARFYKDTYTVNGKQYLLCKEWYEKSRPKFDKWLFHRETDSINVLKFIKIKSSSSTIRIEDNTLVSILEIIKNDFLHNDVLIISRLREQCERIISLNTKYKESPQTVIYCLIGKLSSMKIIELAPNCKKGRYVLVNSQRLDQVISDRLLLDEQE